MSSYVSIEGKPDLCSIEQLGRASVALYPGLALARQSITELALGLEVVFPASTVNMLLPAAASWADLTFLTPGQSDKSTLWVVYSFMVGQLLKHPALNPCVFTTILIFIFFVH